MLDAAVDIAAGRESDLTQDETLDATEWFLAETDDTDLSYSFEINVGTSERRRWVPWTIQPVDVDKLRRIRRQSQQAGGNNRAARRQARATGQQEFDEIAANVQIVLEGTLVPDIRAAAQQRGIVDPSVAVRMRFAHKPGLIAQIAGEIMSLSGYDDEDIREVDAARG